MIVGILGPDMLIALNYGDSATEPSVVYLGERNSWRTISESVCSLLCALIPDQVS